MTKARLVCAMSGAALLVALACDGSDHGASRENGKRPTDAAGNWPMYGFDVRQSRFNPAETIISPANVMTLQQKWFKATQGPVTATPAVVDGVVYVGSWDHNFYALNAADGTERWKVTVATPQGDHADVQGVFNFPGIQSSATVLQLGRRGPTRVYFGDSCGYLHAYPADGRGASPPDMTTRNRGCGSTGKEASGFPVDLAGALPDPADAVSTDIYSSPIPFTPTTGLNAGRLMLYIGAASHRDGPCIHGAVFAIDARSGKIVWRFDVVPPDAIGGGVWSTPAIDAANSLVYVDTGDCIQNGSKGFSESIIALDASCSGVSVDGSCPGLPTVTYPPNMLTPGNPVWAFQSHPNGEIADFDFGSSPNVISDSTGKLLVGAGSKDGAYYAVEAGPNGGKLRWSTLVANQQTDATTVTIGNSIGTFSGGFQGSTGFAYEKIFATTFSGPEFALALDASSGALKWDAPDGFSSFSPVAIANGLVFAGDNAGFLKAWDASNGILMFAFPTGGSITSGPVVAAGRVFVGTGLALTGLEAQGIFAFGP